MSTTDNRPNSAPLSEAMNLARLTRVLIIEDDLVQLEFLSQVIRAEGFEVIGRTTAEAALAIVVEVGVSMVVMDVCLADGAAHDVLCRFRSLDPDLRVIIYTAYRSFEYARDALNAGAFAYVEQQAGVGELLRHISRAGRDRIWRYTRVLESELAALRRETETMWAQAEQELAEQRRIEQSLRDSEQRFRLLAEHATDLISCHTLDGVCIYTSPSCRTLLGYDPEEVTGQPSSVLVHPDDLPALLASDKFLRESQVERLTYRIRRKDGSYVWFETTTKVVSLTPGGPPDTIVCVSRDISERKRSELERQELELQMRRAQRLESLGMLAGGVAHDFSNLLHVIMNHLHLARELVANPSAMRQRLDEIEVAAQRAAELANQMLVCSGQGRSQVEPIDLCQLVREMAQLLSATISKKIWLQVNVPEVPAMVDADITQLRQVLLNLLLNGADAIGQRPGVIRVTIDLCQAQSAEFADCLPAIERSPGTYVRLQVSDTGDGMSEKVRAHVFEPFFTTKPTGRGLGLPVVLGTVRSHRGALRILSEMGQGTTFQIYLPASTQAVPEPRTAAAVEDWSGSGLVLVVDDQPAICDVACRILERAGFRTLSAPDSRTAVQEFRRAPQDFRFALLDLNLPDGTGAELFQDLLKIRPDMPALFTSGLPNEDLKIDRDRARQVDFIQKPYRPVELLAAVRNLLDRAGSE